MGTLLDVVPDPEEQCLIGTNIPARYCGDPIEDNAQVHHIIWKCHNGTDHPKNLMAVCEDCHKQIHSKELPLIMLL